MTKLPNPSIARKWCIHERRLAAGIGPAPEGPYTVGDVMADYLQDYRRRGGKSIEGIASVVNHNILPALGRLPVSKLTP